MADILSAGIEYARQGFAILALSPNSKIPIKDSLLQPNGSLSATTDPEIITKLFTTYPRANIGIACGDSFTVVDLDGPEAKAALTQAGLEIPECRTHKTPRGFHLLLEHQGTDLPQTAGLLDKVDVRNGASNGYIVAPPSVIDGKPYELIRDLPLGQWPELVAYAASKPSSRPRTGVTAGWDDVTQPSWVATYLSEGAPEGQRNDVTARLAGYLNSKHIPIDVARQLLETFRLACDPPMDERELDQTIQSIYRYVPAENVFANEDVSAPVVMSEIANRRVFRWSSEDLIVSLTRITVSKSGIECWIKFSSHTDPLFGPVRLNLLSSSGRESLTRVLKNRRPLNWQMVLDQVSNMVSSSLEEGGAAKDMRFHTPTAVDEGWCVRPYVQTSQPTLMFGFAGNGKSTIATALLLSKASGTQLIPGIDPGFPGGVMYCDWEDSEEAFNTTATALLRGQGMTWEHDVLKPVLYRRYHGALADYFDAIAKDIADHDIKLICVDSLVAASGDQHSPNDAEAARTWHQVMSALGISSIGITHAAKNSREPSAYGSVYYTNLARQIYEVSADAEPGNDSTVIAITHRKGSNTGIMRPVGLRVDFQSDEYKNARKITYTEADLTQSEVLAPKLSAHDRILSLVATQSMSPAEIAEELTDLKAVTIRQSLLRAKDRGVVTVNAAGQYRKIQE